MYSNLLKDPRTNWGYIVIVVISGILVGGGILGYYYLWIADLESKLAEIEVRIPAKVTKDETVDLSSEALATEDWKIYRNEEFGFEIRYPKDWNITNDTLPKIKRAPGEVRADQYLEITNNSVTENPKWRLYVNLIIGLGLPFSPDIIYSTSLTEEKGVKIIQRSEELPSQFHDPESGIIAHQFDGIITISAGGKWGANNYYSYFTFQEGGRDYEPIFNKILSTFKFLE